MSKYKFKTTNIRGKQYVEVNERIKYLRQEDSIKNYSIITEVTHIDSEMCVVKCSIADENHRILATGHAQEDRASSNINKTSYLENCETSAVGRALAMLGIGIEPSIASANEVSDAIAKQESDQKPVENMMDKAVSYLKASEDKQQAYDNIIKKYGDQLTDKQKAGLKKFVR